MGLFDHLFKTRSADDADLPATDPSKLDPNTLPPKPETSAEPPITPAKNEAFTRGNSLINRTLAPIEPVLPTEEKKPQVPKNAVSIELDEILSHIPTEWLASGLHDGSRLLHFRLEEIETDEAAKRASLPLVAIAKQCADVLRLPAESAADAKLKLPLRVIAPQLERARAAAAAETKNEAPAQPARTVALGLASVLRRCPSELLFSKLPALDASAKIEVPIDAIAPQLASGRVELTTAQLIAALPPALGEFIRPRPDGRIPLPLQELLENLPPAFAAAAAATEEPKPELPAMPALALASKLPEPTPEPAPPAAAHSASAASRALPPLHFRPIIIPPPALSPKQVAAAASPKSLAPLRSEAIAADLPPPIPPASSTAESVAKDSPPAPIESAAPAAEVRAAAQPPEPTPAPAAAPAPVAVAPAPSHSPITPPASPAPEPELKSAISKGHVAPASSSPVAKAAETRPAGPPRDLQALARELIKLPDVEACVAAVAGQRQQAGELPEGFTIEAAGALSRQLSALLRAAGAAPEPIVNFTIHREPRSITFFVAEDAWLCVVLRSRVFMPGARTRLMMVVSELAGLSR